MNADGEMAAVGEIQGYNMFTYCFNNPINLSDSFGNWPTLNDVGNFFKGIGDGFVGFFDNQAKMIGNAFSDPLGTLANHWSNPVNWLKTTGPGIVIDSYYGLYQSASSGITTLVSGNAYDIGYRAGQNTGAAAEVVAVAGITTGASKIASKAMPKVIDSKLFSANDGYGFKIGKNVEILYKEPNVKGCTFISYESASTKCRFSWDPMHSFHYHSGFGKQGRIHRKLSIF